MQTSPLPTPYAQASARAAARAASTTAAFAPGQRIAAAERLPRLPRLFGTVVCEAGEQRPGGSAIYWVQFDGDRQQRLRFGWELQAVVDAASALRHSEVAS